MRTAHPDRVWSVACERWQVDLVGALAEVLCGIVGRRAEEYDVRGPSREVRAAGAGTKRAVR
jgi:hypothetical protein